MAADVILAFLFTSEQERVVVMILVLPIQEEYMLSEEAITYCPAGRVLVQP
jgi:hypothetical protein